MASHASSWLAAVNSAAAIEFTATPAILAAPFTPVSFAVTIACVAAIAVLCVASLLYRRGTGKPLFKPAPRQPPLFAENWRSGRSLRSPFTRIGGARNCLWVAVTADGVGVAPHFPFNLMFLPELYGLEHAIPAGAIRSVHRLDAPLAHNRVRIAFTRPSGVEEVLEISLNDAAAFATAVETIRRAATAAEHAAPSGEAACSVVPPA